SIQVIAVDQVFLIGREASAELPVVFSARPGERVGPGESVLDEARGAVFADAKEHTGVEINVSRAGSEVGSNVDAKVRAGGQLDGRFVVQKIRAMHDEMKFVEQGRGNDPSVGDIDEVIIFLVGAREARDASERRGVVSSEVGVAGAVQTESGGELVFGVGVVIKLGGHFIAIVIGILGRGEQTAGSARDQAGFDVGLGYGIDLGGIDDGVGDAPVGSCEPGIGLQKADHAGIGASGGCVADGRVVRLRFGKIALQLLGRVDRGVNDRNGLDLALSLVGGEEKSFVFDDGATERGSELVALQIEAWKSLLLVEVVVGVESPVADEFECAAMDLIGAGLGHDADDGAAVASILGGVVAG